MMVPAGYKVTEVGVIPEGWSVRTIGSFSRPVRGSSPRPAGDPRFFGGTYIPWLTVAALTNVPSTLMTVTETETCLTEQGARQSRTLSPGTLIIANSGATLGVAKLLGITCCANDGVAALLDVFDGPELPYVAHYLNSKIDYLRNVIATGNGQPNLNTGLIAGLVVPVPATRTEQTAIATALNDVDALITALEKLLTKKRDLKQAAMQRLLTGKERLPGFGGEWNRMPLGQLARVKTGSRNNEDKVDEGRYPLFVRSQTVERINTFSYDCEAILVPGEGNIGGIFHYIDGRFDVHQRVYKISDFDESVRGKYLFFQMVYRFGSHAMRNSVKATVDSLRLPTFLEFPVDVPPLPEQTAIANILTSMDTDIATVETRLTKTRALKAGMMQELLTGRIRLQ